MSINVTVVEEVVNVNVSVSTLANDIAAANAARAEQAADDAEAALALVVPAVNQGLSDIEDAKDGALLDIVNAETNALDAITPLVGQAEAAAVQTGLDAIETAADRVQTGLDVIATNADRVQTGLDRVQTGLDVIATAADRVQTGLDVIATNQAKLDAEAAALAAEVAKIEWQGDWIAGTYQASDAVAHIGSSWIANKTTTEEPSLVALDWDLLAQKGDDGDLPVGTEDDLLQVNNLGVFEAKSTELAIARGYYKMKCALNPVFVMQNGTILTGNGGTTAFVEPISSLSYLKLSDLTPLIATITTPMYINVVGLIGAGSPTNKGIILGVDDLNYIELIWNRGNVSIFRRIEAGIVVTTATSNIGGSIRSAPYQLEVNFGGQFNRTGIGYFIKCVRPELNHFFDDSVLSIRQDITFIAFANILNSPFDAQHNIGICGTKFS